MNNKAKTIHRGHITNTTINQPTASYAELNLAVTQDFRRNNYKCKNSLEMINKCTVHRLTIDAKLHRTLFNKCSALNIGKSPAATNSWISSNK